MSKKLVYIGFAFEHHKGTHAGYHQVKEYLNYDYIVDLQSFIEKKDWSELNFIQKIYRKISNKLFHADKIPWYFFRLLWLAYTNSDIVFHFIYGENNYLFSLKKFIPNRCKVVCTFHQPFEWFASKPYFLNRLREIDKIVLVGNKEINLFSDATGKHNVEYIPHGISSDFYCVSEEIKKRKMILTVGNWLRDYSFASKVYAQFLRENPDYEVCVVTNPSNQAEIESNPKIHFYNGISDERLRLLYQECELLFLPLIRYTANNSLLEAAACGCNIVIASDNADNSYMPYSLVHLVNMNHDAVLNEIRSAKSESYNSELREFVNSNYSWAIVAKNIRTYLIA